MENLESFLLFKINYRIFAQCYLSLYKITIVCELRVENRP